MRFGETIPRNDPPACQPLISRKSGRVRASRSRLSHLCGAGTSNFADALGGCGMMITASNIAPGMVSQMYDTFAKGDVAEILANPATRRRQVTMRGSPVHRNPRNSGRLARLVAVCESNSDRVSPAHCWLSADEQSQTQALDRTPSLSGLRNITARGGSVSKTECCWPCQGNGSEGRPPVFPILPPP